MSLDKSPTSEMAKALSMASGGITSTVDLVEGINNGDIGYTTNQSIVEMARLETTGLKRRSKRS